MSDMRNEVPQNAATPDEAPAGQEQGGDVNATGPAAVRAAFRRQARACADLGSPFTARLLGDLAETLAAGDPVSDALLLWPGRPVHDALPLRIAGGLHALARDGRRPALSAIWAGGAGDPAAAARAAFADETEFLLPWLSSPPQTNEPGRSAILLGGALIAAQRVNMPFELLEIGASAGLNLNFDRYACDFGAGRRRPETPPPGAPRPHRAPSQSSQATPSARL